MDQLRPIRHVPTPAAIAFARAFDREDLPAVLAVVDEHWTELWYALDPTDLAWLLDRAPNHLLATLKNANYLARVTGQGSPEDLLEPVQNPGRSSDLDAIGQYIADQRLRGRPAEAMGHIRRVQERLQSGHGRLVDTSGGRYGLWLLQAGITALLADDGVSARGLLLQATTQHRPDRFPFVPRDATAKLALTHAVGGDIGEAISWNARARELPRTDGWVEALIDDTIWLTDYLCAVDTFDPAAETMRLRKPSPLAHLEFWGVALQAHVRHLTLTGRSAQAEDLCTTVAAAGLPRPGSDGSFSTALSDARLSITTGGQARPVSRALPLSAQKSVALGAHQLAGGQFSTVLTLAAKPLPPSHDGRAALTLRLLEAQALLGLGQETQGRDALLSALAEILSRRTLSSLRYLTAGGLDSVQDTDVGRRAADIVQRHAIETLVLGTSKPLTEAEISAMRLLRDGHSRAAIAARLYLSINTVKSQLASAYRKLGASSRAEAVAAFTRLGH